MPTTSPELTWVTTAEPGVVAEVEALAAAAAEVDGTAPLSEQVLRHLHHSGAEHLVARDAADALVGYAQLDPSATTPDGAPDPVAELVVHPDHRRRGTGSALLAALLDREPAVRVWAHGALPAATALAERVGLVAERELWRMRLDMDGLDTPLPDPQVPDGIRIRTFEVGADEAELLRVNNAAFSWHPEQGGWTLDDVAAREAEPWFDPAGVLLAVDEGAPEHVLGFHWTKVHVAGTGEADADAPIGEVYVLGVDPAARGRRLGPALTLAGLAHLRDRGLGAVVLYVEADNTAAVRVYRDLGCERFSADVSYRR